MRRAKSNGRSNTYATPTSPPAPSATSTTSTPSSDAGETRSPTGGRIPTSPDRRVAEVWADEKAPPAAPAARIPSRPTWCAAVRSGKTPYVRFDRNLYSIPHHPRPQAADPARFSHPHPHPRRTDRAGQPSPHLRHLTDRRGPRASGRTARRHPPGQRPHHPRPAARRRPRHPPRSSSASPSAKRPCARTRPGCSPCSTTTDPTSLAAAVTLALERDALGAGSITHILETRRRQRGLRPPLQLTLPDRPGLRDLDVRSHDLETYDALGRHDHDDAAD